MADGDRTAIRIDVACIVGEAERAHAGKRLRGERFVQFDDIEIVDLQSEPLHQPLRRRHRAVAHDARRNARRRQRADFGERLQSVFLDRILRGDDQSRPARLGLRPSGGGRPAVCPEGRRVSRRPDR